MSNKVGMRCVLCQARFTSFSEFGKHLHEEHNYLEIAACSNGCGRCPIYMTAVACCTVCNGLREMTDHRPPITLVNLSKVNTTQTVSGIIIHQSSQRPVYSNRTSLARATQVTTTTTTPAPSKVQTNSPTPGCSNSNSKEIT